MNMPAGQQLFQRYEGNPILTAGHWPYTVNAVFNPLMKTFWRLPHPTSYCLPHHCR
jgi:hypothetical protein